MIQTWCGKELHPLHEYETGEVSSCDTWLCGGDYTSLSVLINSCQNNVKRKYYYDNKPLNINDKYIFPDVIVYMNQKIYDMFLTTLDNLDYSKYFTIDIDQNIHDDVIIASTLDKKYIESIRIIGL